jgi:alkylated DNA repair dioxygenase AlkB
MALSAVWSAGAGLDAMATRLGLEAMRARETFGPGGWVLYEPGFVPASGQLMGALLETLPLKAEALHLYGRDVLTPRLVSWHGDLGASYAYSGSRFEPSPWPDVVGSTRERLREIGEFNSMLVNYYRDGQDSVGFHADDEPELGPASPDDVLIASVSLGSRRRFVLKKRSTGEVREFSLGLGDLLVMGGAVQKHWVHCVPKTVRPVGPRLNLTFRQVRT